jgi:hypothetical protein
MPIAESATRTFLSAFLATASADGDLLDGDRKARNGIDRGFRGAIRRTDGRGNPVPRRKM